MFVSIVFFRIILVINSIGIDGGLHEVIDFKVQR